MLVLGIGGGGDIVGTLPTARLFEAFGAETILGGVSWERIVRDPVPGPRKLDEVEGVRPLHPAVWLAGAQARTKGGVRFTESFVAESLGKDALLIDINGSPSQVAEGLLRAAEALGADRVMGVDVGGDSLAKGKEAGLRSPLCDAVMVAALAQVEKILPTALGVLGYGTDAELTGEEINASLSEVAAGGGYLGAWGMTAGAAEEMEVLARAAGSEASLLAVASFRGKRGVRAIREETRSVELSPVCCVTFYVRPTVLMDRVSALARSVQSAATLKEANEALHSLDLRTELDMEQEMSALGTQSYQEWDSSRRSGDPK